MALTVLLLALLAGAVACLLAQPSADGLPYFVVEPQDVTEQVGRTARLECQVSSLTDSQAVAWMKEATFQTSGRSLLTTDPDKLSRVTVEDSNKSDRDLHFNLFIHNVRPEDAGVYYCYVVEFWELNQRRFLRSRPARLTVVDVLQPSVRCLQPSAEQLSQAARLSQPVTVGCTVLNNQPGMTVKLHDSDGLVLAENVTDGAEPYDLKFPIDVAELRREKVTCLIGFIDQASPSGAATRSCSMGPFIEVPAAVNRTHITVELVPGSDAHLSCPAHEGLRLGAATPETPLWALDPQLPASRYTLSPDGINITISHVTPQDDGLVVSCRMPSSEGGHHMVDMEVRVRLDGGRLPDLHGQQVQDAGDGSRDRAALKPVIGQAAWSVLRGRVSGGRLKPAPSTRPGHASSDGNIHRGSAAGNAPPGRSLTPTTPKPPHSGQVTDNGTSTPSAPAEDWSTDAVTPVTDQPAFSLSPLIIVALCEAGMSVVILIIAFAVLCQCCCKDQTKAKVRGDKDLTLAAASFGKPSTTPTLLTYKSTAACPSSVPDLSRKKLPPIPPEAVYARTEGLLGAKKVLRDSEDLPPTGSWVFSSVNSESGEAETAAAREPGHEIYVTMV